VERPDWLTFFGFCLDRVLRLTGSSFSFLICLDRVGRFSSASAAFCFVRGFSATKANICESYKRRTFLFFQNSLVFGAGIVGGGIILSADSSSDISTRTSGVGTSSIESLLWKNE
jgi:hypothetical protein